MIRFCAYFRVFLAFPGLVFALAVAAALGGGVHNAIIALGAISWQNTPEWQEVKLWHQKRTDVPPGSETVRLWNLETDF